MPLRILVDEHISNMTIETLRPEGHDVISVSATEDKGSIDKALLEIGERDRRLVLTFDKDFGALIFADRVPQTTGVLFLRLSSQTPRHVTSVVVPILGRSDDSVGYFSVIKDDRVRSTLLPDLKPSS